MLPGYVWLITLDRAWTEWAAKHGVSAKVAAVLILLSQARPLDDIVAKLTPIELEQVIKIVGRSPRGYPPGAYDALKGKRNLAQPQPPIERLSRNGALEAGQPAARTNPGTDGSMDTDLTRPASRSLRPLPSAPPRSLATGPRRGRRYSLSRGETRPRVLSFIFGHESVSL